MLTTTTMFQGNLTAELKLRFTTGGTAVAEFRVLVNRRVRTGEAWVDGEPTGHNVRVYGRLAEAAVEQLTKGSRVIVIGRTETDIWPDPETGEKRTATRVIVDRHGALGRALSLAPGGIDDSDDRDDRDDRDDSDGASDHDGRGGGTDVGGARERQP